MSGGTPVCASRDGILAKHSGILLTGATGMLGGYLLRDILLAGRKVVVLARATRKKAASERIAAIVAYWSAREGCALTLPTVRAGDLRERMAGLSLVDIAFIGNSCGVALHAAASLSFREDAFGEPWRTNLEGTGQLLEVCQRAGVANWHQVSTAFVCGRAQGRVYPDEVSCPGPDRNVYEESKAQIVGVIL